MQARHLWKLFIAATLVSVLHQSCRPASYEFVKPHKNKPVDEKGDPNTLGPDDGGQGQDDGAGQPANLPPTARIEVINDGVSVVRVRAGKAVTVRPTADTVDADDVGKSQCANPGIVKAAYDLGTGAKPEAARTQGCESLGVPYTFATPGTYKLDMTVTSNENETAFASMTLIVVDANAPLTDVGGFTIQGIPMLVGVGQDVSFYGFCETKNAKTIAWSFGDDGKGTGAETKHAYAATGQYRVDATCTETTANGKTWDASLTIVVIDGSVTIPGGPTTPTDPDGSDDGVSDGNNTDGSDDAGSDGTDGQPGQNPGQKTPPVQQKPTQQKPTQKLPW